MERRSRPARIYQDDFAYITNGACSSWKVCDPWGILDWQHSGLAGPTTLGFYKASRRHLCSKSIPRQASQAVRKIRALLAEL
jgi:hypothetical protein